MRWPEMIAVTEIVTAMRAASNPYLWAQVYAGQNYYDPNEAQRIIEGKGGMRRIEFEWAWGYATSATSDEEKKIKRSVKKLMDAGLSGQAAIVLEYLRSPEVAAWLRAHLDKRTGRGNTRREAIAADTQGAHARGVSVPALGAYDVDEWIYYTLEDLIAAAQ